MRPVSLAAMYLAAAMVVWPAGKKAPAAAPVPLVSQAGVRSLWVSPTSVSILATDPDAGGSDTVAVTASFILDNGDKANTWTFSVAADSPSFSGCPSVPVSALTISACSVNVPGGGAAGTCTPGTPSLSAVPRRIASGYEGAGTKLFEINFALNFSDSWRHAASQSSPCTLSLTYIVDAQ